MNRFVEQILQRRHGDHMRFSEVLWKEDTYTTGNARRTDPSFSSIGYARTWENGWQIIDLMKTEKLTTMKGIRIRMCVLFYMARPFTGERIAIGWNGSRNTMADILFNFFKNRVNSILTFDAIRISLI